MIKFTNVRNMSGLIRIKPGGVRTPPVEQPIDPDAPEAGLILENSSGYILAEKDEDGVLT